MNEVKIIGYPECSIGNGVLVSFSGKTYFLTSAHVVKKLRAIYLDACEIKITDGRIYYTDNICKKFFASCAKNLC